MDSTENEVLYEINTIIQVTNKVCPECKEFYGVEFPLREIKADSVTLYQCPSCKIIYNQDVESKAEEEQYGKQYDMYMQKNNLIQRPRGTQNG